MTDRALAGDVGHLKPVSYQGSVKQEELLSRDAGGWCFTCKRSTVWDRTGPVGDWGMRALRCTEHEGGLAPWERVIVWKERGLAVPAGKGAYARAERSA